MANYDERFGLTNEDIRKGIDNYFLQLLTEARQIKPEAKTLDALSSKKPTIVYVVGQTGAGKTTLSRGIRNQYAKKGEVIVEVGSDKIATHHRYWEEVAKLSGDERYRISRQFVRPAEPLIYGGIRANSINIIKEEVFDKGESDYANLKAFADSGYEVEIDVMAIDKYESYLSCLERDLDLIDCEANPRPIPREYHDKVCDPLIGEIVEMGRRGLITRTNVYARGEKEQPTKLAWTSEGDVRYPNVQEAIIGERRKARGRMLQNPQEYLERIEAARRKVMLIVKDEKKREYYLNELNQLESEFTNELAHDRNMDE